MKDIAQAKFSVGELVQHKLFDYRGVVVDVDHEFAASEDWYQQMAKSRPPKDRPWYHVLVDGSEHSTYVAERNLEPDTELKPVRHPMVEYFFRDFEEGKYLPIERTN